ncbi:MAG: alpha/beta fold hydrolase [Solirubrobacteraceae bacterium]
MATVASRTIIGESAPKRRRWAGADVFKLTLSDGRAMSVREWDGPGGTTMVLLHGLLDSSEGWNGLAERLSGRRIAFDLAGFGDSDAPCRGSIAGYANDVMEGLDKLAVDRFTLVGHSLGGAVATALAERLGDRVEALILLAPAGFGHIRLAEAISIPLVRNLAEAAMPIALSSRTVVTTAYMTVVANRRTPAHDAVQRVLDRGGRLVDGAREGTRAVVEAGRARDAFHRRKINYAGPVLAVWGDRDRVVPPSHRHALSRSFANSEVVVWAGMGHHHQHERGDDLLALVQRALAGRAEPEPSSAEQARAA